MKKSLFILAIAFMGIFIFSLFTIRTARAVTTTATNYGMKVLVLKYFPLTANGQNINIAVTGDIGDPYQTIRQKTINITNNLLLDLPKSTSYLGYKDPNAQPSLTYQVVDTKEYTQAVPTTVKTEHPRYPDYNGIMLANNICNYVDNLGVNEVWMYAYQGPPKSDKHAYLEIEESKMSGPFGDISNSPIHYNDMPLCRHTYRVYTFNYGRGTAEAIHSWGHQIENEMLAVDRDMFLNRWQGIGYPLPSGQVARCGNVHYPPNASDQYDYANSTPRDSDCLNWNPDVIGQTSPISCLNWGCQDINDNNNAQLNFLIWDWQNLPGKNNVNTYKGIQLRNWWDIHGNFDQVMGSDKSMLLNFHPSPAPTYLPVHVTDSFNRTNSTTSLTKTDTGQTWSAAKGVWGISGNTAYSVTSCPAPGYAVIPTSSQDGKLHLALSVNHQDVRIPFRYIDLNNMYWVENTGLSYEIDKFVGGVKTTLTRTYDVTPKNGDTIDINLTGPTIQVMINNVLKMGVDDASLKGTKFGIGTWCDTSVRFDNFSFDYSQPTNSVTLTPVADTYIASDAPTSTFGGTSVSLYTNGNPNVLRKAFIRFDLGPVVGKTLTKATLRIHTTTAANASSIRPQDVHFVDDNLWQEQTMSWNHSVNPNSIRTASMGSLTAASKANTDYDIPLTFSDIQPNLGGFFSIQLANSSNDDMVIGSRESTASAKLILNF